MSHQQIMSYQNLWTISPKLPYVIVHFYNESRSIFNMTHDDAYLETIRFARKNGLAVGEPGLPAHESKTFRLLTKKEL